MDFASRRERLLRKVADCHGVGSLLVTGEANVRWLTGLDSSNAAVLLTAERTVLATDARYEEAATGLDGDLEMIVSRAPDVELARLAETRGQLALGIEARHVTVARRESLADALGGSLPLVPVGALAEQTRSIKDAQEIALIREACRISTDALAILVRQIRPGDTEIAVARRLEGLFGDLGADDRSFPTIVAGGAASASPHHRPTHRELLRGDLLLIDFGAEVAGYRADCTRMFVVDDEPALWQQRLHDLVDRAGECARAALAPGVEVAAVDEAARAVILAEHPGEVFGHGTGHGLGLEVHEAPGLAPGVEGRVEAGQVVTVEPGAYLRGRGGVRIEDVCVVDEAGIEVLTTAPRVLLATG